MTDQELFEQNIDHIGKLYEEGKDCLNHLVPQPSLIGFNFVSDLHKHTRLYEILSELRDISVTNLKQ